MTNIKNLLSILLIFVFTLTLYLKTLSHSVYFGDSAEYITVAYLKGVAHSPGYPLYSLFAWLFGKLPLPLVFAAKINLLSALFGAGTSVLTFLIVFKLTRNRIASIFSSLFLAFSYLFWLYSLVAEVFILNVFFAALLIFLALNFYETKKQKFLYLFSFFFGLSLTHHHTILLLVPGLAILLFDPKLFLKPKILLISGLLFLLGLLPYLYLPWAASGNPVYNWGDPKTLEQFAWTVLRKGYGTFALSTEKQVFSFQPLVFYLASFLGFGILAPFVGLLGFLSSLKEKRVFLSLLLAFFLSGPFFILYSRLPWGGPNIIAVSERFFLLSHLIFGLWVGLGLSLILSHLNKLQIAILRPVLILILAAGVSFLIFSNFSKVNQNKNYIYYNFGKNMLSSMEKGAVLLSGHDVSWMIGHYLQYVEQQRPDVRIVNFSQLSYSWYQKLIAQKYQGLTFPVSANLPEVERGNAVCRQTAYEYPIYIDGYTQRINPFLNKECQFIPKGVLIQLLPKDKKVEIEKLKKENDLLWASFLDQDKIKSLTPYDARTREIILFYSQVRDLLGRYYYKSGQKDWAEKEFNESRAISKENADPLSHLAVLAMEKGNPDEAIRLEEEAIKINPQLSTSYYNLGKLWMKQDPRKAKKYFEKFLKLSDNQEEKEEVQRLLESLSKKL